MKHTYIHETHTIWANNGEVYLDILEKQIQLEITKAELKTVTELKNFINKQN